MDGRLRVALPAALFLALALSGCMQQPHFENAGASEVTARANLAAATHAAKSWDPTARLVAIAAAETADENAEVPADPAVANGLAVQWTYAFVNNASDLRYVDASADGTIVLKNETQAMDEYGSYMGGYAAAYQSYRGGAAANAEPLGDWSVDSDRAVRAALENGTFAEAAQGDNATLVLALGETDVPGWTLLASSEGMNVVALVNQTSGEVTGVRDLSHYAWQGAMSVPAAPPTPEKPASVRAAPRPIHLDANGTLTPSESSKTFPFHSDAPTRGTLNLSATLGGDARDISWAIMQGTKVLSSGGVSATDLQRSYSWTLRGVPAGDFNLVLGMSYVQGVVPLATADYHVVLHLAPTSG
ncbi:MAG: hypothetical protein QOE90_1000 [Thermoplasmata archaeon]|jgi:hypothetical protein|nr:hypothetical protein [Thermoplasmata archaeon]